MSKVDWNKRAEKAYKKCGWIGMIGLIAKGLKAESRYRKVKKARICPIGTAYCAEAANDKSKMCSICWREFERR